jgi:murein DD-endopeptidase MepM/ murein hydrolase activator NlpD
LLSLLTRALGVYWPTGIAAAAALLSISAYDAEAKSSWFGSSSWFESDWHRGPIAADLESELGTLHNAAAAGIVAAALEAEARPATVSRSLRVERGDTLMGLLVEAGIKRQEAHEAITALSKVYSPRKLKPGQEIRLRLAASGAARPDRRLLALSLQPNVERDLRVLRTGAGGFAAEWIERPLLRLAVSAEGTIENNLSSAAKGAGLPMPVLVEMIRIFSFDVDFQRELQPGDSFEVLYEALFEDDGNLAKTENVLYASLTLSGRRLDMYGFTPKGGADDFFDSEGQSVRKTLMRTPVDGARLSSRFGMRRHPILGYSRMHQGIDFAAPRGTPIYAAGDGVIESAGRNGGYGKYVRIRHNSAYKTAYAHMSRIAKRARRGKRVRQGQVIGFVGSTGRSTGPHLHYEVMRQGRQVNPLKIKLPSGEKLEGKRLESFHARREQIDALRELARQGGSLMARAGCLLPSAGAGTPDGGAC